MRIDVIEYLKSLPRDEIIYFYPNPGNGGDSLISSATFQLFRKLGIKYRITDYRKQCFNNKIFIYAGGGNLVKYYSDALGVLKKVIDDSPKKIIILPHTIEDNEDLLKIFNSNVDIICREYVSYQYVKDAASKANVLLADDMAFYLDVKEIINKNFLFLLVNALLRCKPRMRLLSIMKRIAGFLTKSGQMIKAGGGVLNVFRTDLEKTNISIPENNIDLPCLLSFGTYPESVAFLNSYLMLVIINNSKEIRTNRLHVAIAGALLGKQVFLYPNSYYKNEAVYNNSLKENFLNVHWTGNTLSENNI